MDADDFNGVENEERDPITHDIIGAAFEVHRVLGYGFLEKVYQRAMQVELKQRGRNAELEHRIPVQYKGEGVGEYAADLLVENRVLVELKVASDYQKADEAQLLNELKATSLKVGLLINFGRTKVEFKRAVF
ncbi:MAG: GxxExxY protein [Verrucomicrobiota bacterium]|jgi:GxxExxY protein